MVQTMTEAQRLINKADAHFRNVDPVRLGRYVSAEVLMNVLMDTWDALYATVALANDLGADLRLPEGEK